MTTAREWIENVRGLDPENLTRLGVKCGPWRGHNGAESVAIPYVQNGKQIGYKVRIAKSRCDLIAEGINDPFKWTTLDGKATLWNVDILDDETLRECPVIVTEGEIDALTVIECGHPRTVSIPHGAQSGSRYVLDHAARLKRSPCVIIAGDSDKDGEGFIRKAAAAMDGHPVRYCVWPKGCKDANETLVKHGAKAVTEAIGSARLMCPDPDGGMVTGFSDAPPPPSGEIYRTGDSTADLAVCFHSGFPTVITGTPGSGKSTFLTWALWHAGRQHKARNAVCLMETPTPILREHLCRMETGRGWADLDAPGRDRLMEKLDAGWRLMHRKDEDDVAASLWWIKEMMRVCAVRDGCRIVTFDPWNELDHKIPKNQQVTDYVNDALAQMRQWAERFDVALCIVAHPTKMQREAGGKVYAPTGYDISGSSAWFNKAAVGVTVHRVEEDDGSETTQIINWKSKFQQLYGIRSNTKVRMEFDESMMVYRRRM